MKISLDWVKDFTEINIEPQKLCELLSLKLSEVENFETTKSNDVVIEIENKALTHRGDCFSIEGIAREISAITKCSFNIPNYDLTKVSNRNPAININVESIKDCPRYTAVKITNIKLCPSPQEIQTRLINCGIRPINNIVDFTNYAMLETGQPLHAFDAKKLNKEGGYNLGVRRAREGENVETLDDVTRNLSKHSLIITNDDKPIALAGIMGGKDTEMDENTTEIILEAANFNNFVTRKSSRKLGLRTEASLRFEKNLDSNLTKRGIGKFIFLINKYNTGKVEGFNNFYPEKQTATVIETTLDFFNKNLGIVLKKEEVLDILSSLTFKASTEGDTLKITIPTFRRDVSIKEDLVEEIARIYGYENITPKLPSKSMGPTMLEPNLDFIRQVKELLKVLGYSEIYSYSFVGEDIYKNVGLSAKNMLEILNPISPQLMFIRDNLLPSMYEKVELNKNSFDNFKLFEIGKEIHKPETKNDLPQEIYTLCVAYYDKNQTDLETLYRKAKGDIETFIANFSDEDITLEPAVIKPNLVMYKINLEELHRNCLARGKEIKDISKHPPVIENISFYVKKKNRVGNIIKKIKAASSLITTVELEDTYKDEGDKSITLKIVYQDINKSLSDYEIAPIREQIIRLLEKGEELKVRK
ncbi:MAG: phenylalanine--tRNA ligase subunit beta [Patescibacteria group bacterium]